MPICHGVREVGKTAVAGGGQVDVVGGYAYIGHMDAPDGTTVIDVRDPKKPKIVAEIKIPADSGLHSHKARVGNGIMLVNHELTRPDVAQAAGITGGLVIYDVSNPAQPKQITKWTCGGRGVHRFTFDGRTAYISPEMDGYVGNIVMILDLADPANPKEVGRWWMPGQHTAGGETPTWQGREHRCHHPIRQGDRLYVSYWHGGGVILDISDMGKPKMVSSFDWSPPFPWPTHSVVPVPFAINGQRYIIVADEDVARLSPELAPEMSSFLWFLDVTDETRPVPVSTFQVEGVHGKRNDTRTGLHQPVEVVRRPEIPVAWFAQGLRFIDFSNPMAPKDVAHYVPDPQSGKRVCSNDVFEDDQGLVYLIDRYNGLAIVERV
jgi:hypothetical protein